MDASCRKCDKAISLSPSQKQCHNYICNACANRHRDADVARYLARKLADTLRRQGYAKPYPGVKFVRQVLVQCQGKSVLSGRANQRHLCVIRKNLDTPFTLDNAILVTSTECYAITRTLNKEHTSEGKRKVLAKILNLMCVESS